MAYNYQYSKPFSQNGAPVAPVNLKKDLIGVSVPTTVSAIAPWGHISKDKTLEAFQKYLFSEVKLEGIATYGIFKTGGGIIGNGSSTDPLKVDKEWVTDRYMPALNFPISQVGDPSDFILPISGSYFSVSYPLAGTVFHATAYLEGNGDLRLLHHVTNGETVSPVYAVWKNYKRTNISTMLITDVPYNPPGLSGTEFIQNVYFASETAMVAEIHNADGFQEHALIILNGTFVSKYHNIVRLGHQLFTKMLGLPSFQLPYLLVLRSSGITACVASGRYWVGAALMPANAITNVVSSFAMAEVVRDSTGNNGTVTAVTNTKTTNTVGGVVQNPGIGFILHRESETRDESNLDAMFVFKDFARLNSTGFAGASPANSMSWSSVTNDGKIVMMMHHYHAVNSYDPVTNGAIRTMDVKPIFYYLIDPIARTCEPAPAGHNRRWTISSIAGGYIVKENTGIVYNDGHYWANGHVMQIIGDGTRLLHRTPSGTDTPHQMAAYVGSAENALGGTDDANFRPTLSAQNRRLDPIPPTPLTASGTAYIVHGNMIADPRPSNGVHIDQPLIRAALLGNPTDKEYLTLNAPLSDPKKKILGYTLNNDRVVLPEPSVGGTVTYLKNGVAYYHNAVFFRDQDREQSNMKYGLDSFMNSNKRYTMASSVYDQMFEVIKAMPFPEGYTEMSSYNWLLFPGYPGIGKQQCVFKILLSFRVPDPTTVLGYRYGGSKIATGIVRCTTSIVGDVATITSIETSDIPLSYANYNGQYYVGAGSSQHNHLGGIIIENEDGSWDCNLKGGSSLASDGDSGFAGWQSHAFRFDPTGKQTYFRITTSNHTYSATWHPVLGLGYVDPTTVGIGAFYAYQPLTVNGTLDATRPTRILTSARPAAGFSFTVSAPIPVYVRGNLKQIQPQLMDLRSVKADPRFSTFYLSVVVSSGTDAELEVTLSPPVDTDNRIYLGKIVTNETEITEMILEPVTRWENKRVSTDAVGSAIIVSTGFPGAPGEITAISAGIDPTRTQGTVTVDSAAKTVTVQNNGSFYIQDKDLAIQRFGDFEQIYISVGVDKGRCWINGVEVWKGKGQSSDVTNRNALLRNGWNTVAISAGYLTIRGPFLNR